MDADTIYPTHQCFDDVGEWLNFRAIDGATRQELESYTVVHAIILDDDDKRIPHAWIERGCVVRIFGLLKGERVAIVVPREEWFDKARVQHDTRYTVRQFIYMTKEFGPGPWVPEYRALCRDG